MISKNKIIIILSILLITSVSYTTVDIIEKTHIKDPSNSINSLIINMSGISSPDYAERVHRTICTKAQKYNIDTLWALSMAFQESNFDSSAIGRNKDYGLFQVTEAAIREYERYYKQFVDRKNIRNIEVNTEIALGYFALKLKESATYREAIAKYNAGIYYNTAGQEHYNRVKIKKITIQESLNGSKN